MFVYEGKDKWKKRDKLMETTHSIMINCDGMGVYHQITNMRGIW